MQVPPEIDGAVGEQEWGAAAMWTGELLTEEQGLPSGMQAVFWVGFDDQAVYFATRVILPDPEDITDEEYRPNVSLRGNDSVTLGLDPFGNNTGFSRFSFNQNGATNLEIQGGRANKAEWLGQFVSSGRRIPEGWEGEARIPWGIMPLPAAGTRDIKFSVDWYVSQIRRELTAVYTRRRAELTPTITNVAIPVPPDPPRFRMLPYTYVGYDADESEPIGSLGMDIKTFFNEIQAVGTINPDFRNIEGEVLDLDFSNFERLAGESRPFFQEGSQYRETGMRERIFASQRLDVIDLGLNLYGNIDERTTFGTLATVDWGKETALVASMQTEPDPDTNWSGTYVGYDGEEGSSQGGRIGGRRRYGDWSLFTSGLFIDDSERGPGYKYDIGTFWSDSVYRSSFNYSEASEDLFARAGFIPERDYRGFSGNMSWEKAYVGQALQSAEVQVGGGTFNRLNGDFYRNRIGISGEASWANGFSIGGGIDNEHFEGDHNVTYGFGFGQRDGPYRGWQANFEFGNIRGMRYRNIEAGFSMRPMRGLQVNLSAQQVELDGTEEQIVGTFNWIIGRYESAGGRLVFEDGKLNWFLSFRHSGGLGAEWFIVLGDPNADEFRQTLIFKLVWPFSID